MSLGSRVLRNPKRGSGSIDRSDDADDRLVSKRNFSRLHSIAKRVTRQRFASMILDFNRILFSRRRVLGKIVSSSK